MIECKHTESLHVIADNNSYDYFNIDYYDMRCPSCGTWLIIHVPEYIGYGQEPRWMELLKESLE